MSGNKIQTDLLFNIAANTAELKQALDNAKGQVSAFSENINKVGSFIKGAFAAGAIIGAAKAVFDFSQQTGQLTDDVNDMTGAIGDELVTATARAKAISDSFGADFNQILNTSNSLAKNLGISISEAMNITQQGMAGAGTKSNEFLSTVERLSPTFQGLGFSAGEFAVLVNTALTEGFGGAGIDAVKKASQQIRLMSDSTRTALENIGISADQMQTGLANGSITMQDVIRQVSTRISELGINSSKGGEAIKTIFGKSALDAGQRFFDVMSDINLSLQDQIDNASEISKAQLRLSAANEELNKVWVQMFGNANHQFLNLKASMLEIAGKAIKGIIKGTVDLINFFIQLYNESMLFRYSVEQVVFWFRNLWEVVKLVGKNIYDTFSSAGDLIKAVFTGNFKEIPTIYANAMKNVLTNTVEFAQGIGQNFRDGIDGVLRKQPIKLITLDEVEQQAVQAGQTLAKETKKGLGNFKLEMPKPDGGATVFSDADLFTAEMGTQIQGLTNATTQYFNAWTDGALMIDESLTGLAVPAINAMGEAMVGTSASIGAVFDGLILTMLGGIQQVINKLLMQAIAAMIAGEAVKGLPGLIAAGIGIAGIMALFHANTEQFANGGIVQGTSPFQIVGEKGMEAAMLPRGSKVFNHGQTARLLESIGGGRGIVADVKIKGEDLYLVLKEVERRRK